MRSDYLQQSASVTLDANGAGTVFLKPDVGQYWTPRFVRVSTLRQTAPIPYCAVYQGAVTIRNQSTFIDDTYMGNGDTSSIIAGTVVQFGEAITAVWTGGNAGDTAILTVYGSSQDTPPAVSDMPTTPGTHFSGKTSELALHVDGSSATLATGGELKGPVIDMRPWASYYLTVTASRAAAPTNYNPISCRIVWFADAAGTTPIYADVYEIWARTIAPFATIGGRLMAQDALHGPFMQVIVNNLGPDNCDVNYELIGTTRGIPAPYFREMSNDLPPNVYVPDNFIIDPNSGAVAGLAAGTDFNIPGLMRYGRARWRLSTNQNVGIFFQAGSFVTNDIDALGPLVAGIYTGEIIVPKRSLLVTIHNNAAAPANILFNMISQNDKV